MPAVIGSQLMKNDVIFMSFEEVPGLRFEARKVGFADLRQFMFDAIANLVGKIGIDHRLFRLFDMLDQITQPQPYKLQHRDPSDENTATRVVPMMREYTVFNVDQCENLPARVVTVGEVKPRNAGERDATIDEFLASTGATIREGFGEAYYRPGDDVVSLPRFEAFKNAAHFYSTAFHELGHATGHKSRLARDLRHRFGDRAYAAEELVAELCSAFLCAEFSIDGGLRHAGYIQNWIGLLKADNRAFFTACSKAQAAANYLRGLALAEPTERAA